MIYNEYNCPICHLLAPVNRGGGILRVDCPGCGNFELDESHMPDIGHLSPNQRALLSSWLREHQNLPGTDGDLSKILETPPPAMPKKAELLMLFLAKKHPKPGTLINIRHQYSPQESQFHVRFGAGLFPVCWCEDEEEFLYLVNTYLTAEKNYFKKDGDALVITPKGWSFIETLGQSNPNSTQVFVAMWLDKVVYAAWEAIEKGIKEAGYKPLRIDRKEHNNKIDDEIVVGIRRSKFLVADFTGHRGGVYFETGFAMGLGLPVIWLCRKDELEKTHFDTRQYNFIVWEDAALDALSRALQNRIVATIGCG
jgi:hypothetical protein